MKNNIENLKEQFINLALKYSSDNLYVQKLWKEIYKQYSSAERYYHTLHHLAFMFSIIKVYENKLKNNDAVLFSVWFHDIIYDTSRKDNEEQSAEFATRSLKKLNAPQELITKAVHMILLTENHSVNNDSDFDTKLFLDADLAILGGSAIDYNKYIEDIRKEYREYEDMLYKAGRKKILQHFLERNHIYKTEELRSKLEKQASENISLELKQLSI